MQRTCLFLFFFIVWLPTLAQPTAYHVVGRCNDIGTGLGLKASIYALSDGQKQKLGEARDVGKFEPMTGTFDVLLPVVATHLLLEMPRYRTVTIPVHFISDIPAHAVFAIRNLGDMTSLDSLPKPPGNEDNVLSLYFDVQDKTVLPVTYRTVREKDKRGLLIPKITDRFAGNPLSVPSELGSYSDTLTTSDGRFIASDRFMTKPGITFKVVRVSKPVVPIMASPSSVGNTLSRTANVPEPMRPTSTTLLFDQSSYDLRTQTLPVLDSLASVLISQPLQATLTGYTDNVGARNPNVTLSEYRARRVATYLTGRGVAASRLVTQWRGPEAATDTTEAIKAKSRRVEVRVGPK